MTVALEQAVIEVSIIIPCLNEAETIFACVEEARQTLMQHEISGEVIVADNGSTDGSQVLAQRAGALVVPVAHKGYGNALLGGIEVARGKYILMGDADGSYSFSELPRFLEELRSGSELVMGCRLPKHGGSIEPGAMPWLHRWVGNPVLSRLGKLFFKSPVNDFHCGIRAFDRAAIKSLNLRTTGMEFASEMVVKASLRGLKMSEVPVTLRPDGRSRRPHLRTWRDGWRHLRFLLLYCPKWLLLYPGIALFLIGLIGFAALLPGPLYLGQVAFDTNTLIVASTLTIVGFQIMSCYIFVKAYAMTVGLLPEDPRIKRLLAHSTAEIGIVAGVLLLLAGLGLFFYAFLTWEAVKFGQLSYPASLRLVIPAATLIALGVQSIFGGFIMAIFSIKHK